MPLVLQPPGQGADEGRPRRHGHVGLVEGVDQVDVDPLPLVGQGLAGAQAFQGHRDLEDRRLGQRQPQNAMGFGDDFVVGGPQGLHLELGHHGRELDDGAVDVAYPVPVHEGGGRGQAADETQPEGRFNFTKIGGIEVQVH